MSSDNELGLYIHGHLKALGIETPMVDPYRHMFDVSGSIEDGFRNIMQCLKLNLSDDSLADTPKRVAKMYTQEIFYGLDYANFPRATVIENKMKYDEMISQRATVMSLCEHHFVPFMGTAYIGYIPRLKVIGLSKMNRIVDFFARRPQVQERLTVQIAATLDLILDTEDVAVVIQAEHLCVKLRGVKDGQSHTTTSKMGGKFMKVPALRAEFLALANRPHCA